MEGMEEPICQDLSRVDGPLRQLALPVTAPEANRPPHMDEKDSTKAANNLTSAFVSKESRTTSRLRRLMVRATAKVGVKHGNGWAVPW